MSQLTYRERTGEETHHHMSGQLSLQPQKPQTTGKVSDAALKVKTSGQGGGFRRELGRDLWRLGP